MQHIHVTSPEGIHFKYGPDPKTGGALNCLQYKGEPYTGILDYLEARVYYLDGQPHREDGPAIHRFETGNVEWWWMGFKINNIDQWAELVKIDGTEAYVMLKLKYG